MSGTPSKQHMFYAYFSSLRLKNFIAFYIFIWFSQFSYCVNRGPFLKSQVPKSFRAQKAVLSFAVFAFKIKVSLILKLIQWNYWLLKE